MHELIAGTYGMLNNTAPFAATFWVEFVAGIGCPVPSKQPRNSVNTSPGAKADDGPCSRLVTVKTPRTCGGRVAVTVGVGVVVGVVVTVLVGVGVSVLVAVLVAVAVGVAVVVAVAVGVSVVVEVGVDVVVGVTVGVDVVVGVRVIVGVRVTVGVGRSGSKS